MNAEEYYSNAFSRNIGVLTAEEQDKLKNTTFAVAGLGGIGGAAVSILARMGIQKFKLADIDTFSIKNLNRQVGSTSSVLGKKKTDVLRDIIKDINPYAEVECFDDGVQDYNVSDFLSGVDIVLDAIDWFCFTPRFILQTESCKNKIPVLFSAPLGCSATFLFFTPDSMSFVDYFDIKDEQSMFEKLIQFTIGVSPKATHLNYMDFTPERVCEIQTGPSLSPSVHLGGALLSIEALKYLTGKATPCIAPEYLQLDLMLGVFAKGKLRRGNRGIRQRVKAKFAYKKYIDFESEFMRFIK